MKTQDEIESFLNSLGSSPDEIAESLRKMNIKGKRSRSDRCPIANVLTKKLNEGSYKVSGVVYYKPAKKLFRQREDDVSVFTPPAVFKFISKFDQGFYPTLEQ